MSNSGAGVRRGGRRRLPSAVGLASILALVVLIASGCVSDLGVGGTASMGYGASANGWIAGWVDHGPSSGTGFVQAPDGTTTLVGDPGAGTVMTAVNDFGVAVGVFGGGPEAYAIRWSAATGVVLLSLDGGTSGQALAINHSGVAGGYVAGPTGKVATLWLPDGTQISLASPTGNETQVAGLNDAGVAVGRTTAPDGHPQAVWWEAVDHTPHLLDPTTSLLNAAAAINASGDIVGWVQDPFTGVSTAALWAADTHVRTLLPGGRNATAINASGTIVGYSATTTHAVAWTAGTHTLQDLGGLGSGSSVATGITTSGRIIGYAHDADETLHAVQFTAGSTTP